MPTLIFLSYECRDRNIIAKQWLTIKVLRLEYTLFLLVIRDIRRYMPLSLLNGDNRPNRGTGKLSVDVIRPVTHGGRGVPRPRPLGELTAPRWRPLNDDLTGNGLLGLDIGVTFGVVLRRFRCGLRGSPRCYR